MFSNYNGTVSIRECKPNIEKEIAELRKDIRILADVSSSTKALLNSRLSGRIDSYQDRCLLLALYADTTLSVENMNKEIEQLIKRQELEA